MSICLTADMSRAVPITPISKSTLPQWIKSHPSHRDWLNQTGFKGEPGSFAFLPGSKGTPERVLAAHDEVESVWAFAGLPMTLPEGNPRTQRPRVSRRLREPGR